MLGRWLSVPIDTAADAVSTGMDERFENDRDQPDNSPRPWEAGHDPRVGVIKPQAAAFRRSPA